MNSDIYSMIAFKSGSVQIPEMADCHNTDEVTNG